MRDGGNDDICITLRYSGMLDRNSFGLWVVVVWVYAPVTLIAAVAVVLVVDDGGGDGGDGGG